MVPNIYRPVPGGRSWRSVALAATRLLLPLAALVVVAGAILARPPEAEADPAADWFACTGPDLQLPLGVSIGAGVDAAVVRAAMAEWNAVRPGTFVEASSNADVEVVASARTWVKMPCGTTKSTVYVGNDVNLSYWMAHELGHTLRLADHIPATQNTSGYINPKICPAGYVGVMSYCTPRSGWWGAGDVAMLDAAFPLKVTIPEGFEPNYRSVVPGVAR